jgi:hypothetical protein
VIRLLAHAAAALRSEQLRGNLRGRRRACGRPSRPRPARLTGTLTPATANEQAGSAAARKTSHGAGRTEEEKAALACRVQQLGGVVASLAHTSCTGRRSLRPCSRKAPRRVDRCSHCVSRPLAQAGFIGQLDPYHGTRSEIAAVTSTGGKAPVSERRFDRYFVRPEDGDTIGLGQLKICSTILTGSVH